MADTIIREIPREKQLVLVFSQSIGHISFTTFLRREEIVGLMLQDRDMTYIEGVSDFGWPVHHYYDLKSAPGTCDIRMLAILKAPSGKIAMGMPGPMQPRPS